MRLRGYYAVLCVRPADAAGLADLSSLVGCAEGRLAAVPCCLQIRGKGVRAADLAVIARAVLPACRAAGVPLCVNDRLDVALAVGADAVHLGQDDLPLAEARAIAAGRLAIGISTHSLAQALSADQGGADYLGFGPVFRTTSKPRPGPVVGVDELARACAAVAIPVVAIGGVGPGNVVEVAAAGAAAAAAIASVDEAPDPVAAARAIAAAFR